MTSIDKPALVVPPDARPLERIRRILVLRDGIADSSAVLPRAAGVGDSIARECGCEPDGVRVELRVGHPAEHLLVALARSLVPVLLLPMPRSSP